ncbi:MAG: hypothetical protein DI536_24270 [Archangium gephyra]|uniref:Uncharacterized protein n=1 Tax=Archangium gephyra TaxID=48 RepID=A0A2W5T0N1_9BACT|nr:MAG: hypothetical protein DI536_24270 [Archangium gephyra]
MEAAADDLGRARRRLAPQRAARAFWWLKLTTFALFLTTSCAELATKSRGQPATSSSLEPRFTARH